MIDGRQRCLNRIVNELGATAPGRELGLHRTQSLEDFRASFPIRDVREHAREVETRFGFGLVDATDPRAISMVGADVEREHVCSVWNAYLGESPRRIALLRGHDPDPIVDRILVDDLRQLGGELLRLDRVDDGEKTMNRLEAFDPDLMVVPSAVTCRYLERVHRLPLEHRLRRLTMIFAEHDLRAPLRTRTPLRSAGWLYRSGRVGLASMRRPTHAVVLAVGSQIIELLPYSNPEDDGRRVYAAQTVLPEQAMVGHRYEIVVSSPLGFVRMRTDEHVRVVGFDTPSDEAPFARPRVVRLMAAPGDVRLEGCTVAGAWLTASVRQALWREDPALVTAEIGPDPLSVPVGPAGMRTGSMRLPSPFKDTELGWLAQTASHRVVRKLPRAILVRMEVQGWVNSDLSRRLCARIDANLRRRSPAYAYLRGRDDLEPPRVIVLPAGTHRSEEERRITELVGPVRVPDVRVVER